jgi:hypothetical protein
MANGLWYTLGSVRSYEVKRAEEAIELYAKKSHRSAEQVVHLVQKIFQSEAQQAGGFGMQRKFPKTALLLPLLFRSASTRYGTPNCGSSQKTDKEDEKGGVRELWSAPGNFGASLGRKSQEQSGSEPPDALLILSRILARCEETISEATSLAHAQAFPLTTGVKSRVGRLRGYGNSIVPQVAAEVIRAYMECGP